MKALCLTGVFLVARALILVGHDLPLSLWTPVAYLWQDLIVVVAFALAERIVRRPWIAWTLYAAIAGYVALNVPLVRLLSSPLTWPMIRATRGTLADSIQHHLTFENLRWAGAVMAVAAALPFVFRRACLPRGPLGGLRQPGAPRFDGGCAALGFVAVALAMVGSKADSRVDTAGLHRNVLGALITSRLARVDAKATDRDWRQSPFHGDETNPHSSAGRRLAETSERDDFSRFRGAAAGRNVVMILLESTGAQYLKPYGAAEDPMPHLTELAGQSILFENACAVYPESIKGLFSVLCSRYPAIDTRTEIHAQVPTPSIGQCLADAGYRTALFHSGRFAYLGMEGIVHNHGFQILEDAGDIGGNRNSSFGVDDEATVQRMLRWIDSVPPGERFFITYLPVAGHHPYETPDAGPFPATNEVGRYRNALHYSDSVLDLFFRGLKEKGLFDKTLFLIFGDHGEAFGQHEGNFGHTLYIHEENLHVPYLVVAPGLIREPLRVRRVTSLIDTAPTILDLLGLPAREEYQGGSLLAPHERMALFYTDYSLGLLGLRDRRWKLVYELDSGRAKLFDLVADPFEARNAGDQHPARLKWYRTHLESWSAAQRELILRPRRGRPDKAV